ncbi:MAG: alpha/beta hydrolase family protein [Candidatus Nitrospinota bacterium M3_3B_026]
MRKLTAAALASVFLLAGAAEAKKVHIDHDGRTLNGYLALAEGKKIEDGVILMVHGTLAHGRMEIMRTLQGLFRDYGQSTLAITLSLGKSGREGMFDCGEPHRHMHTGALDEIGLWLAWLKEQGAGEIVLLGHSRGGNQAAWFAAQRDDPAIKKIVLLAPMTWTQAKTEEGYEARYETPLNPILHEARAMISEGRGSDMLEGIGFLYCRDAAASARTFVSYYSPEPMMDTPLVLRRVKKPVLVFTGTRDTSIPDVAEKIKARELGDNVRLEVIDGADHFFRDLFAYDVVERTIEFLGR